MPKYFRDSSIEYELQLGASNKLCSRACARSLGFLMGYSYIIYVINDNDDDDILIAPEYIKFVVDRI